LTGTAAGSAGCLRGRRALVTGSTQGIGLAMAERFLAEGAQVVFNSEVDDEHAAAARTGLSATGFQPLYIAADVSVPAEAERLVTTAAGHLGGLDLLVNCAAFVDTCTLEDSDDPFIDRVLNTNLRGPMVVCRTALPWLKEAAAAGVPACVINIGSGSGLEGHARLTAYSASKGGLHAFTRALARELKGIGVRCNAVIPGWIENAVPDDVTDSCWQAWLQYLERCPLGRAGSVHEVAAVAARLASVDFSYVNGQLICVDGGAG